MRAVRAGTPPGRRRRPGRGRRRKRASAGLRRPLPEEYVESATQGIRVHEQGAASLTRRGDGERAGQRGGSGPTAAADHADGERGPADSLGHVGDAVDQPLLAVRQHQDMVGADLDGPFPDTGVVLVPADQYHSASARGPAHAPGGVVADQHERCGLPTAPALRHSVVDLRPRARRRAQAQQVVEEFGVLRDDQWSALPPLGGGRTVVCDGSRHDLQPPSLLLARGPQGSLRTRDSRSCEEPASGLHMNGRYEPAKRVRQTEPAMNLP